MRPRLNCISGWQGRIKGGTWVHQARIVERATMLTRFVRYCAVIAWSPVVRRRHFRWSDTGERN
jgi:hypothetical protein